MAGGEPGLAENTVHTAHGLLYSCITGIKHEWQANGLDGIQAFRTLAEKLGGNMVVSLEGKQL